MAVKKFGWLVVMVVLMVEGMYGATPPSTKSSTKVTNTTTSKTPSSSQKTPAKEVLDSHYKPGTFAVNVGIDLWAFAIGGFGFYPGAELSLGQYAIENQIPLDFGVAVQGFYYTYSYDYYYYNYSWRYNYLGVGVFGVAHFGPKKSIPTLPEFLERVDFYAGIGLFFRSVWYNFSDPEVQSWYDTYFNQKPSLIGFASIGGVTYFLTDKFGIRLDGSYYGYGGATLSIVLKF